jgi:hypothetical protein
MSLVDLWLLHTLSFSRLVFLVFGRPSSQSIAKPDMGSPIKLLRVLKTKHLGITLLGVYPVRLRVQQKFLDQ